ncbi:Chromatin assembly factor 1 subunit B [Phytophthora cinnamomi]|uniref:Chromatin assembly factor 1 subunit B n=1 Tax=Phytophthora cinnamomi TaxID=4785 RepID=UPI00355AC382|nr:Chromatin assembly factor 1 subunit B [Phytophthora cinnamomi]
MEFGGAGLTPRISELYGASGGAFRVGEADAYAQDLDELEREERALENMVQELVNRPAAVPIGVKFHREGGGAMLQQAAATDADSFRAGEVAVGPDMRFARASSSEEEEEEGEDEVEEDLDEDEMMMDEDDEEEEETTGRATIVRGEGGPRGDDSFARDMESGEDSMDMEEELPPPRDWQ